MRTGVSTVLGLSALPYGGVARNAILRLYKTNAVRRGLEWSLTEKEFDWITQQLCHYCGTPPSNCYAKAGGGKQSTPFHYNGLDRKDNNRGYIVENVLPCCGTCNRAKGQLHYDEFLNWIERLRNKG